MNSLLKIISLVFFTILSIQCLGQDLIITRNGNEIISKVLEITLEAVKYKKFENSNGPTYSVGKNEVLIIRYQNGTKSVFDENVNNNIINSGDADKNLVSTNLEEDISNQDNKKNSFNLILELGKAPYATINSLSYGLGIGYAIVVKSSRFKIQNELIYRRISSYYTYYAFMPSLQFSFKEIVSKLNFIGGVGPSVYIIPKPYFQNKNENLGIGANIYAGIKFNRIITKARYTTTNAPYDNLIMFGVDYSF
ncbi:MAG: hypothetical protein RL108_1486 [Bacteroidota bacterium]|jgi:hypothetical protein